MTIKKIQLEIELFQDLITKSRTMIAEGHFVDISKLDTNANHMFSQIKCQYRNLSNIEIDILTVSVETLLCDFDRLAKELNNQYTSLSTETKIWPNTAIAAYQN
jgi:hypothetical protein